MSSITPLHPGTDPSLMEAPPLQPRRPRNLSRKDLALLAGACLSSLGLTWLMYTQLLPFQGSQGFLIMWVGVFLLMYFAVVREIDGTMVARDRVMSAALSIVTIAIVIPLVLIVGYVLLKGLRYLRPVFFTSTMSDIGPLSPPSEAGGLQSIVGTLEQVGIAALISVPLGVLTAVYLNEVRGRLRVPVRVFVDAMSGVPSIVAGLFIYSMLIADGGSFSGFAAALALSVLMLPTVTRTAEVVLRLVPDGLREASLALGSPRWKTVWRVVLPTARTGLITATLLGVARVVGETAPLIMTAFGSTTLNVNPFSGPQASLPLSAFRLFQSSQIADVDRAWTFATVLILLVLVLFVLARRIGRRGPGGIKS
jgi:phosphate transport system permease protein